MIAKNRLSFTYLSYKSLYSFQTIRLLVLFRVLDPLLHYCFFATLAFSLVDYDFLTFVLLGNLIFVMAQTMIINLLSMFRTEKFLGTLELNVAAPKSLFIIILKKSVIPILDSLLIFLISMFLLTMIFNISFTYQSIPYIILTVIIGLFSLLGVSLLLSSFGLFYTNVNLFLNITLMILQVFCGVNFSTDLLPSILRNISYFLPTTHTIEAIRLIYKGNYENIMIILLNELMIGIIYFLISFASIKLMVEMSKRNGSLFKDA